MPNRVIFLDFLDQTILVTTTNIATTSIIDPSGHHCHHQHHHHCHRYNRTRQSIYLANIFSRSIITCLTSNIMFMMMLMMMFNNQSQSTAIAHSSTAAAAAVAAEVIVGRGDDGMEGNRNRN
ncbi:hypothetical protein DERF_005988 [Dermatophagoides farinae]|uniref:Uncharacterized protein n=1 Tax=Dermatophagoides farinae TaxID=6954 RepID=A0A922L776_DERFA|nr:hypothetical protein DERF_005988 [Dermatophagoides farinae]